jgi:broad specificity phosphatase PhoE
MTRLLLVRHGTTSETRRAAFPSTCGACNEPGCPPLDRAGEAQARALAEALAGADRCWSSLARRSADSARLAWGVAEPHPDLAECDFGAWAGLTPDQVHARDPEGLARWYAEPDLAPHGGEGLGAVRARAALVLARAAALGGATAAATHGGLIKAALLEVLELPSAALWRLDAHPGSVTELRHAGGAARWRVVRVNWTPTPATGPHAHAGPPEPARSGATGRRG